MDSLGTWLVLSLQLSIAVGAMRRLARPSRYRRRLAALVLIQVPLGYLVGVASYQPGDPSAAEVQQFLRDYRQAELQAGPMTNSAEWPAASQSPNSNGKEVAQWQTLLLPTVQP